MARQRHRGECQFHLEQFTLPACSPSPASTAVAETKTIATAGNWTAFAGRDEENRPVCGVRASDPENSPTRRVLMVKWWSGGANLAIQAAKASWRIPAGTQMRMTLRFDGGTRSVGRVKF